MSSRAKNANVSRARRSLRLVIRYSLTLLIAGCAGNGGPCQRERTVEVGGAALVNMTVTPTAMGWCGPNESTQLRVIGQATDGSQVDLTASASGIVYTSSSTAVASVNAEGLVTSVGVGDATITATYGTFSRVAAVTVKAPAGAAASTGFAADTAFLYTGADAVQVGVAPCAIDPARAAVLRGKVTARDGQPLASATITILNHPEFGETHTGAAGVFDMAVEGGQTLTVVYKQAGMLPAQRQIEAPVNDYAWLPDVVLVPIDNAVTTIDLAGQSPPAARGNVVADGDGTRQATLLFSQGTTAEMTLADGQKQALTALGVRATEYSVGSNGPQAMPAILPPTSAYTYCVDLAADEALAAAASEVRFDQPQYFYVDDFIGFPVGSPVPSGYYDAQQGQWVPSQNGLVIEILSITGGLADLDTNGDGAADGPDALAAAGVTDEERTRLAELYPQTPKRLWRVPVTHFSPWDCNWPSGGPSDATGGPPLTRSPDNPCRTRGSKIEVQARVMGESMPLVGTPFTLEYRSDRPPRTSATRTLELILSGSTVPASLKRIELDLQVAGQRLTQSFPGTPGQKYVYTWDGKDAYGRNVAGNPGYTARIGYIYDSVYQQPAGTGNAFAQAGDTAIPGATGRSEYASWTTQRGVLGTWDPRVVGLGGWMLSAHHVYDVNSTTLYQGNGRTRTVVSTQRQGNLLVPAEDGSEVYVFDTGGRHMSTLDPWTGAVRLSFAYDGQGRLASVEDASGNVTVIERAASGDPSAITAPFGQRTVLTVDANGVLTSLANPAGEANMFTYTADGLLTGRTDPRGLPYTYAYDAGGNLVQATDPAGGTKQLARTDLAAGFQVTLTTAAGLTQTYTVENTVVGQVRQEMTSGCCGKQVTNFYPDDTREALQLADGSMIARKMGPDPRWGAAVSRLEWETDETPSGVQTRVETAATVSLADPNDPLSLQSQTWASAHTLGVGYDYQTAYDATTRSVTATSPDKRQTTATLDGLGRLSTAQAWGLAPVQLTYDAYGRLEKTTSGTGAGARTMTFGYDAAGRLATATDPLARTVGWAYDAAGRVTQKALPDGRHSDCAYDANGNMVSVTPPGRPAHTFTYTLLNLVETYTPPALPTGPTVTHYAYDPDQRLIRLTRPDGTDVTFTYDAGGRMATASWLGGSITYTYDASSGRPLSITTADGQTVTYTYDGSLCTSETFSGDVKGSIAREYTAICGPLACPGTLQLFTEEVNGERKILHEYSADGLLRSIHGFDGGHYYVDADPTTGLTTGVSGIEVDTTVAWNSFAELTGLTTTAAGAGTPLLNLQYTRDAAGRISAKTETVGGATTTYEYGYDLAGRLATVRQNGVLTAQYEYDNNDNRTRYTDTWGNVRQATYDVQDRLTDYGGTTYTYTLAGELESKTIAGLTTTYTYDPLGNLRQVVLPDGTQIEYVIDGLNRRVGKRINGVLVRGWLYRNQFQVVAELDGAGNVVSRFVYGNSSTVPEFMYRGGQMYGIVSDHLGSPRLVVDWMWNAVQRMDYDEFGQVVNDTQPGFQPFGFAGGLYDGDTGLVRHRARDYDAETGRWTAKDPALFVNGPNLYLYARNDPVNLADISGSAPIAAYHSITETAAGFVRQGIQQGIGRLLAALYGEDAVAAWLASTTSEMGATAAGEIITSEVATGEVVTGALGEGGFISRGLLFGLGKASLVGLAFYGGYKLGQYIDRTLCLSDWISDYWRDMLDPKPEGTRIYSSSEEFKKTQTLWYNLFGGL